MNAVEILGKIIEVAQSNLEIPARVGSILSLLSRDLYFDEVILFSFDKDKKLTCRYASQDSVLWHRLKEYRCLIGEGIVGTVGQKRMPHYFTARDIPPRFGCLFYGGLDGVIDNYRSFAFLPVNDDSHLYGVLLAASASRESVSSAEKILLSMVCREIGGVLRTNELLVSTKRRITELATLSELGRTITSFPDPAQTLNTIALIITRSLNAAFTTIRFGKDLLKTSRERFVYGSVPDFVEVRLAELEKAAQEGKRQAFDSVEGPQSRKGTSTVTLYSAPILARKSPLGVLTVGVEQRDEDSESNGDYRRLVQDIAAYLSSGFENMVLNVQLKSALKELSEAQRRIIEQEKLRSLGEMTANIAHEIKNPLVVIGGFTKRLAKRLHLEPAENRYVEIIVNEVDRLEKILGEVLDYVKEGPALKDTCNINECLEETIALFVADSSWDEARVEREYAEGLPPIACDRLQLRQVFINILMNSYEAMDGRGIIQVATRFQEFQGKPYVTAAFSDTGGGMNPAILENIFNPFFTTKEKGTGLGLAISNKIILSHMGHIEVHNMPGMGVTFCLFFPAKISVTAEGTYGNH